MRVRRTISLKPEVDNVLEDKRGKNNLSTYLNDFFEDKFKVDINKKSKLLKKKKN